VIQGEDDPYGTMRQVEILRQRAGGPVESLTLPAPCGHAPHADRAADVLLAMAAFVRRLGRDSPVMTADANQILAAAGLRHRGRDDRRRSPPRRAPPGWRARLRQRLEARGTYPTWALVASLAGMFATTFPVTILTVSLRVIGRELDASETTMAWVISAPLLLSAISLPLLGKVGDLRGHRAVFLAGSAASALIAVHHRLRWSAPSLIVLRTLAGMPRRRHSASSMALIWNVFGPLQRTRAMGYGR
jgi:hypothetical protein